MVGISIGSEYPGAASWATDISKKLPPKVEIWIILFTCSAIDVGFLLVPWCHYLLVKIGQFMYGDGSQVWCSILFLSSFSVDWCQRNQEAFEKNRFKR